MSANTDQDVEMVLVPRRPTKEMLEAARYDALAEDAASVWASMIEQWIKSAGIGEQFIVTVDSPGASGLAPNSSSGQQWKFSKR